MKIVNSMIIGMGAIGTVYGSLLHKKYGNDFAVIAGGARAEKLRKFGAVINGSVFYPNVLELEEKSKKADIIILCVKNYQLKQALEDIRNFVGENTLLLPLLNGITARDEIFAAYPKNKVFYGLTIHIDAVRTDTGVENTEDGIIQFGYADNTDPAPDVLAVKEYLSDAGIQTEVYADMMRILWRKWMLNVGGNQMSAVTGAKYSQFASIETNRTLFLDAMMEVVALARAAHVNLTEQDALQLDKMMETFTSNGKTSMLQDVEAKRRTEVDNFAGTVVELGKKYSVPTPVNHVLYCIIKSKEQMY